MNTSHTKPLKLKIINIRMYEFLKTYERNCSESYERNCSQSCPFIACLNACKETQCFISLPKLFQLLVPQYANVHWQVAVL